MNDEIDEKMRISKKKANTRRRMCLKIKIRIIHNAATINDHSNRTYMIKIYHSNLLILSSV